MNFGNRLEELHESSQAVLLDCALDNGAIVAANTDHPPYPPSAVNYRYVWGRDAAYQILARDALGLPPDIPYRFAGWLMDHCQDFEEHGVLIKRYATNGGHDWRYGRQYQPDQAGALMFALDQAMPEHDFLTRDVLSRLATGLAASWRDDHFTHPLQHDGDIQDLWEDQSIGSDKEVVFTYSLAAATAGLSRVIKRFEHQSPQMVRDEWVVARDSMRTVLLRVDPQQAYPWLLPDTSVDRKFDASLNFAVWPFADPEMPQAVLENTVLGQALLNVSQSGTRRYFDDRYDGIEDDVDAGGHLAGTWPLLGFASAIALHKIGRTSLARQQFEEEVGRVNGKFIPEQNFDDDRQGRGPMPLAWSHAMFVLAARELGYTA